MSNSERQLDLGEVLLIKLQSRKDIAESALKDMKDVKKNFTHYNDEESAIDEIIFSLEKDIAELQMQIYILYRFLHKLRQTTKLFKIRSFSPRK